MSTRLLGILTLSVLLFSGCVTTTPSMRDAWFEALDELRVEPVYPPRSDVQVGDVYLCDDVRGFASRFLRLKVDATSQGIVSYPIVKKSRIGENTLRLFSPALANLDVQADNVRSSNLTLKGGKSITANQAHLAAILLDALRDITDTGPYQCLLLLASVYYAREVDIHLHYRDSFAAELDAQLQSGNCGEGPSIPVDHGGDLCIQRKSDSRVSLVATYDDDLAFGYRGATYAYDPENDRLEYIGSPGFEEEIPVSSGLRW